jgi:hypothetical protein
MNGGSLHRSQSLGAQRESVCIMSAAGQIVGKSEVESEPKAIAAFLCERGLSYGQVGIEVGPFCKGLYAVKV